MKHIIFSVLTLLFLSNCNQVLKKQEETEVFPNFSYASYKRYVMDSIILSKVDKDNKPLISLKLYKNKNDSTEFVSYTEDTLGYCRKKNITIPSKILKKMNIYSHFWMILKKLEN